MDGLAFEAYVTQVLVPTLRPGDIVVMDNLAAHKLPAALFARSQSDRNGLRKAQSLPSKGCRQIIEALDNAIALALAAFTAQECLNFFAEAGYDRV
jgi:hypothetical protein